jgi:hypothetical protein
MNYTKLGRVIWVALVASVYSADAGAQSPGCATPFMLCSGCDTSTTITVQSGKVCEIPYLRCCGRGTFSGAFQATALFSQRVVVRPRGGIYGTANQTSGAYKPNPGFVGKDSFQVDIEFERQGQRHVTHLKANVNVLP